MNCIRRFFWPTPRANSGKVCFQPDPKVVTGWWSPNPNFVTDNAAAREASTCTAIILVHAMMPVSVLSQHRPACKRWASPNPSTSPSARRWTCYRQSPAIHQTLQARISIISIHVPWSHWRLQRAIRIAFFPALSVCIESCMCWGKCPECAKLITEINQRRPDNPQKSAAGHCGHDCDVSLCEQNKKFHGILNNRASLTKFHKSKLGLEANRCILTNVFRLIVA